MMFKSVYIVKKLNAPDTDEIHELVMHIKYMCESKGIGFLDDDLNLSHETLIISLGGDGTMMYSMKLAALNKCLCIGVNLGNLGFLTPFDKDFIYSKKFTKLLSDTSDKRIEKRYMIDFDNKSVINEFVLASTSSRDMIQYEIYVDNVLMGSHTTSAFVLSTASGSTAYALNCGGSILSPDERIMQILNVNPASLGTRPIMLGHNKHIKVAVTNIRGNGLLDLRADGVSVEINDQRVFEFSMSNESVDVLLPLDYNFFNNLSDKLSWNKHFV